MLIDILRLSFKNLGRKKSRSALTILGIAIGVASVVLIASLGEIGKYTINEEIDNLGGGGLMVTSDSKAAGTQLTKDHLEAIRSSGAVESAIPVVVDYTKTYMRGLMLDTVVWGIDYGANQVITMEPIYGRLITKNDVTANKRICVIDQNIAQAFYKRDNIVGKTIQLQFTNGNEDFEIVGVVSSGGNVLQGLMGEFIPSFVYIPYTTMQEKLGRDTYDRVAVQVREGIDEDVAGTQLANIACQVSGVRSGYKSENMQGQKDKFNGILNTVTILLSVIAGISLIVAGLSIMTMMMVSVGERTREIGIKKSIGANRNNILVEFLIEAFIISLLGSLFGTAAGILLIFIGCMPFGLPVLINMGLIVFCILFSVAIGVIFGVYPASLAANLNPVEALRCD